MPSHEILSTIFIIQENKFQSNLLNTIGVDFVSVQLCLEDEDCGERGLESEISVGKG